MVLDADCCDVPRHPSPCPNDTCLSSSSITLPWTKSKDNRNTAEQKQKKKWEDIHERNIIQQKETVIMRREEQTIVSVDAIILD